MNAHEMAVTLGRRGGRARAKRLSAAEKQRIAALGGQARAASRLAARRIADNFLYLAAVRELRGDPTEVARLNAFRHRLPGIYASEV